MGLPDIVPNNWFTYWIARNIFNTGEVILTADVGFVFSQHQQTVEKLQLVSNVKLLTTVIFTGLVEQYL